MKRRNLKEISQRKRTALNGGTAWGMVRAGMHQRSETEYRRSLMMAGTAEPEPVPADEALDIPEVLEEMIPPETVEEPETAEISADEEILDYIESSGIEDEISGSDETMLSADYSAETVTLLDPVTGGVDCGPRTVIYDPGDGTVRVIPDPLGVLTEEGIHPFLPEIMDPSANVAAMGNE